MTAWDSVRAFFKREAADVREGLDLLRQKLDAQMTRREAELEATPAERVDMIREDIESSGSVLDDIEAKIDERLETAKGESEVSDLAGDQPDQSEENAG